MAVNTTFFATGTDKIEETRIAAAVSRILGRWPGNWKVALVGNQSNLIWQMTVSGPDINAERNLDPQNRDQPPESIAAIVAALAAA